MSKQEMSRLNKILETASETQALRIGQGIINEVPIFLKNNSRVEEQ